MARPTYPSPSLPPGAPTSGGGHLLPAGRVSYEEVLQSLSARSDVPSTFGAQLAEQARRELGPESHRLERERQRTQTREEEEARLWHTVPVHDQRAGYRIDENAHVERTLFDRASVLNCIGALTRYRAIDWVLCPDVKAFARTARCKEGEAVVGALHAYEQWGRRSPINGLAALYAWMCAWSPAHPPVASDEETTSAIFRAGRAPLARRKAAMLLADSDIVLAAWVEKWNRRSRAQRAEEEARRVQEEAAPRAPRALPSLPAAAKAAPPAEDERGERDEPDEELLRRAR